MIKIILLTILLSITIYSQSDIYDLIIQYEEECYADSSEVSHHVGDGDYSCVGTSRGYGDFTCLNPDHYNKMIWVHKDPTWDGFREFVKKYYKRMSGEPTND